MICHYSSLSGAERLYPLCFWTLLNSAQRAAQKITLHDTILFDHPVLPTTQLPAMHGGSNSGWDFLGLHAIIIHMYPRQPRGYMTSFVASEEGIMQSQHIF